MVQITTGINYINYIISTTYFKKYYIIN